MEYYYSPRLLPLAVRDALEIHHRIAHPSKRDADLWLAEFLAKLKASSDSEIRSMSEDLRLSQLRVLAQYLPHLEDDGPQFSKVLTCLRFRPDGEVCAQLWGMLGKWCDAEEFVRALDDLRGDLEWQSLLPETLPDLPRPMFGGERIALWLSRSYSASQKHWLEACSAWVDLAPDTPVTEWERLALGRHIARELLLGPTQAVYLREDPASLLRWADDYLRSFEEFRTFGHLYLRSLAIESWADIVVDRVVETLGDPRLNPDNWKGMEKRIVDAIVLRINTRKLERFFLEAAGDRARFEFWRNFVADMGPRSIGNVRAGQGLFEFPGFGVVEFMHIGNAAYLYLTDEFETALRRIGEPNGNLKDRRTCIGRILHGRSWQDTWVPKIRTMIERGKRGQRVR